VDRSVSSKSRVSKSRQAVIASDYQAQASAAKCQLKPRQTAKRCLLDALEALAGPKDQEGMVRSDPPGALQSEGGVGWMIARAILLALASLRRLNKGHDDEGDTPALVARLAGIARDELGNAVLAAALTCSADAARDGLRCAARHTWLVTSGSRHKPASIRAGLAFKRAVEWVERATDHPSVALGAHHFGPDSPFLDGYLSPGSGDEGLKTPVYGQQSGARTPAAAGSCKTSELAGRAASPAPGPVQLATVLTTGGHPVHPNPATMTASAWIIAVVGLGSESALRAAALILDHERAVGESWSDVGDCSAVARRLLEGQAARHHEGQRIPRVASPDVKRDARGLQQLQQAGLIVCTGDAWYRPAPARGPWSLAPELVMYSISPSPAAAPMPAGGWHQREIVAWMRSVEAPSEAQSSFLGKLKIDAHRLSKGEAAALQRTIILRAQRGLKHWDVLDIMSLYGAGDFAKRCIDGEPGGGQSDDNLRRFRECRADRQRARTRQRCWST